MVPLPAPQSQPYDVPVECLATASATSTPRLVPAHPNAPLQLCAGNRSQIPAGQGVRIGGEKYMWLRELKGETYIAKVRSYMRPPCGYSACCPPHRRA